MSTTSQLPRIAILSGDDTISLEAARARILDAIYETHDEVSTSLFDASAESLSAFLARFVTVSLFAEARIFQVRHAEQLNEKDIEELESYLDQDIPDSYLIIEAGPAKKNTGVGKKLASMIKKGQKIDQTVPGTFRVFEFARPRDWEIADWVVKNAPHLSGRTVLKKNAEYLVDLVGHDLGALYSELQKLDLLLPSGVQIDKESIDRITGATRVMEPYELAQAVGTKNLAKALEIIDGLFSMSFYAPLAISALFRHFWALFRIRKFAQRNPEEMRAFQNAVKSRNRSVQSEIGVKIGVAAGLMKETQGNRVYPVIIKSGIVDQARSFKDEHIKQIIRWLGEFDLESKTGKLEVTKQSVQLLCCRIVRVAELQQGN